ncbi:oligopeptide/dipeptide ABC transporter ATP-binding protein [Caldilinea sp.]|uniref:ABC transporter ATP-binding protein n=1 Tax=Caldilinea sp. TaxID=2293560 RepID=UPI002C2833C4|nr:ATP-binding cassette domain-containing protein [Caldilinea sp.]HRA66067.1 ATP-binding cassette domain-containing protein [Caldilinea sp.]
MHEPLLRVRGLRKLFPVGRRALGRSPDQFVHAVDDVSFDLAAGEALALVGESGCGKSTLALTLLGLETATAGSIHFEGNDLAAAPASVWKAARRHIQMIFQDPYESLNPLMTVGEIVAEPLHVHKLAPNAAERRRRSVAALEDAGLKPAEHFLARFPHELSGGQRQRVAIATALVLEPRLLVADEPVSMLDVSIRAEILNLLADLKMRRSIAVLFITHDLGTVSAVADRIAVMYLGRIVETGAILEVMTTPRHPYTQALLSVVPAPNPRLRRQHIILQGETPDPVKLPTGCRFHPRCPMAVEKCRQVDPALQTVGGTQAAACIRVGEA